LASNTRQESRQDTIVLVETEGFQLRIKGTWQKFSLHRQQK